MNASTLQTVQFRDLYCKLCAPPNADALCTLLLACTPKVMGAKPRGEWFVS